MLTFTYACAYASGTEPETRPEFYLLKVVSDTSQGYIMSPSQLVFTYGLLLGWVYEALPVQESHDVIMERQRWRYES